jgi:glyoxylase-like metal-dependent hydrolase (beta-lactamase superfamily II)
MIRASRAAGLAFVPALVLAAFAFGSQAQAAGPAPVDPAAVSFRLGAFQLTALRDDQFAFPNDGKVFGVDAGPAAVSAVLAKAGAPTDTVTVSVDALLVRGEGHVVLLDTGVGAGSQGVLQQSLAKAGVTPDQITDVLITHSHGDHIGGLVAADGRPAFPKAVIRMSANEWAYLQTQGQAQPQIKALVEAIAPQVKTFAPGQTVVPGVTAVGLYGHTPGHVGYEIVSGGERLLDIGDSAHSSIVSLAEPGWIIQFDHDAQAGKASRIDLLTRLSKSHEVIFAPHFPFPGLGRIEAEGQGFVWKPTLGAGQ